MANQVNLNKSLVVVSKNLDNDNLDGGEETEIAAQVTIPPDGGWGWVVVVASFLSLAILYGVINSFGPLLPGICKELNIITTHGALINSLQVATHLFLSPVVSALINQFGFRAVGMTGSIICSLSALAAYFTKQYISLLLMYGLVNGIGCSLSFLASSLVVGFYFQKLRSIVLPLVSSGTSVGIMTIYQVHVKTVALAGWRTTILLQSGLFGLMYFLSLTYRPLPSMTIVTGEEGSPTRTVTFLPTMQNVRAGADASRGSRKASTAERALGAVSNANFPTAASIIQTTQNPSIAGQPGTSTSPQRPRISSITLKSHTTFSNAQIKKMQSIISTGNLKGTTQKQPVEITIEVQEEPRGKTCCGRCCHWQSNPNEARPMYRDDVFYQGELEKLPNYQKSVKELPESLQKSGLGYQLEVSRAVTLDDLKERAGVCTTAIRRTLATMLDLRLMSKPSFAMFSLSNLFIYSGILVPYVFLQVRGEDNGMSTRHSTALVSVVSLANLFGRAIATVLTFKFKSIYVYAGSMILAGSSTMASSISYTPAFQFGYSVLFGVSIAGATCLRGVVIVDNYGLENLTNAFGIALMFNGIAAMYSSPLAAFLKDNYGYGLAFYVAGGFIAAAGVAMLACKCLRVRELKREKANNVVNSQK